MESIRQIYRIGHGPSSSHTMGPMRAAQMFLERNRGAVRFNVTLYGSLAATGKGHMTDAAILEVLQLLLKRILSGSLKSSCRSIRTVCYSNRSMKEMKSWNHGRCTVSVAEHWRMKVLTSLKQLRSMR